MRVTEQLRKNTRGWLKQFIDPPWKEFLQVELIASSLFLAVALAGFLIKVEEFVGVGLVGAVLHPGVGLLIRVIGRSPR